MFQFDVTLDIHQSYGHGESYSDVNPKFTRESRDLFKELFNCDLSTYGTFTPEQKNLFKKLNDDFNIKLVFEKKEK